MVFHWRLVWNKTMECEQALRSKCSGKPAMLHYAWNVCIKVLFLCVVSSVDIWKVCTTEISDQNTCNWNYCNVLKGVAMAINMWWFSRTQEVTYNAALHAVIRVRCCLKHIHLLMLFSHTKSSNFRISSLRLVLARSPSGHKVFHNTMNPTRSAPFGINCSNQIDIKFALYIKQIFLKKRFSKFLHKSQSVWPR